MPKGRSRRRRRELNPAVIVPIVLATGVIVVAGGLGLVYWLSQSPEPARSRRLVRHPRLDPRRPARTMISSRSIGRD